MIAWPGQCAVSGVVPTRNSAKTLRACLESVEQQVLRQGSVELIVVDGGSSDATLDIAGVFADAVLQYVPPAEKYVFTAPHQRNLGAAVARGAFIYYVDADMVLPEGLLAECVDLCLIGGAGAVIIPEESFGETFWATVKRWERSCYVGNDLVEAPRFVNSAVWRELGGLDSTVGGGGDDWDLHIRLKAAGVRVVRAQRQVMHNEGALTLGSLARKRFMYGKEVFKFVGKHGFGTATRYYTPFSRGYGRVIFSGKMPLGFVAGLVVMRAVEYGAGLLGIGWAVVSRGHGDSS